MKITYYSQKGTKTKDTALPKALTTEINDSLLAQAFHVYRWQSHAGFSKTQTRAEVSRTTAKWYKQKGTGRARHGAKSAPIFVGGGKAHGAKGIKRSLTLSQAHKKAALLSALNVKVSEGKVVVVADLDKVKKTKDSAQLLEKVLNKDFKSTLVVFDNKSKDAVKFFRNIKNCEYEFVSNLNAYKLLLTDTIVFDEKALEQLKEKYTK